MLIFSTEKQFKEESPNRQIANPGTTPKTKMDWSGDDSLPMSFSTMAPGASINLAAHGGHQNNDNDNCNDRQNASHDNLLLLASTQSLPEADILFFKLIFEWSL